MRGGRTFLKNLINGWVLINGGGPNKVQGGGKKTEK